jgi:hypothetical protein
VVLEVWRVNWAGHVIAKKSARGASEGRMGTV